MDFGFDPPVAFDRVLDEMEIRRSWPSSFYSEMKNYRGTLLLNGQKISVGATAIPEGIIEFGVDFSDDDGLTFLGIPLATSTSRFTQALDERFIPWVDDGKCGIVLYEHWLSFFDDVGEIKQILWYNRELVTDLEMLDMAFPPKR